MTCRKVDIIRHLNLERSFGDFNEYAKRSDSEPRRMKIWGRRKEESKLSGQLQVRRQAKREVVPSPCH